MPSSAANVWRLRLKSPSDLAQQLARHWHDAGKREQLLLAPGGWPMHVPIGRPTAAEFTHETARVRAHVEQWRSIATGDVQSESIRYRNGAEPVVVPTHWILRSATEWADASNDALVQTEQRDLAELIEITPIIFHRVLVRQRGLWRTRSREDILKAAAVAMELAPGYAEGRPLRSVAVAGVDSKFFERHAALVTALLDARFDGEASKHGLVRFLNAADESEHWLLVAPLAPGLLPFARQRVRARELLDVPLPARRILIIENERCLHLLPALADTIAVLGAGLNLAWMECSWLRERTVGYWGDIDTWGLQMLAQARRRLPHLQSFLMTESLFDAYASTLAVNEGAVAAWDPPPDLTAAEQALYARLRSSQKGRLEQEFLPRDDVVHAFAAWGTA